MNGDRVPDVSVVCAWYNRAGYIRDSLDSLLAQDCASFEVVIVNDGSPDPGVREILDSYDDPRLRVLHQENTGFTTALRGAIARIRSPFVAIHGAGDISHPRRLRLQLDAMRARPDAAIVGCRYRRVDLVNGGEETVVPRCPKRGDVNFSGLSHGELMYRRAVYDAVGGYRPVFHIGQGSDIWMRLLRAHEAVILEEELYEQRYFADGVALSPKKLIARKVMNALREENERVFRETGVDHIDIYGAGAFAVLAGQRRVVKRLASIRQGVIRHNAKHAGAPLPFGSEAPSGRGWVARLLGGKGRA